MHLHTHFGSRWPGGSENRQPRCTNRCCANKYWVQLCTQIHTRSDNANIRDIFEGMKKATGPTLSEIAPLKSKAGEVISGRDKQMVRWVECFIEIYGNQSKKGRQMSCEWKSSWVCLGTLSVLLYTATT